MDTRTFKGNIESINGKEINFSVNVIEQYKTKTEQWKGTIIQSFRRKNLDGRVFVVVSQELTLAIHESLNHGQTIGTEIKQIENLEQFLTELKTHDYFEEIERENNPNYPHRKGILYVKNCRCESCRAQRVQKKLDRSTQNIIDSHIIP